MAENPLIALAARCEAAEGANRELDCLIATALGWREVPNPTFAGGLVGRWYRADGTMSDHFGVPRYTALLDAAMTLVPEGWIVALEIFPEEGSEALLRDDRINPVRLSNQEASAATPALALCAAALRARAAHTEDARP